MVPFIILFTSLWLQCAADDYYYYPFNVSKTTLSGVAAYRSALTLDWLANEDNRQRELVMAFETAAPATVRILTSDCISYPKPASGKVARLMLELLRNLEGDEGSIIADLSQALVRSKILVETSMLDSEPNLEALVKTPGLMLGEPHATFPRVLGMVWMTATDSITTKRHGWCPITKVSKYLTVTSPVTIAQQLHQLDPVLARVRFIMEEFIQHVTPINVYDSKNFGYGKKSKTQMQSERTTPTRTTKRKPTRTPVAYVQQVSQMPYSTEIDNVENLIEDDGGQIDDVGQIDDGAEQVKNCLNLIPIAFCMEMFL